MILEWCDWVNAVDASFVGVSHDGPFVVFGFGNVQSRQLVVCLGFCAVAAHDFVVFCLDDSPAGAAFDALEDVIRHLSLHLSALGAAQRRLLCVGGLWCLRWR